MVQRLLHSHHVRSFSALNALVWHAALGSIWLCGYLKVFDSLEVVLKKVFMAFWGTFFAWKNFRFYYSTHPRRRRPIQQSALFSLKLSASELLLATAAVSIASAESLDLLPIGWVLLAGDIIV